MTIGKRKERKRAAKTREICDQEQSDGERCIEGRYGASRE
jgi:hypothetical protein